MGNVFLDAKWIGEGVGKAPLGNCSALCLRKRVTLDTTENAVCYISGLGLYALYINGARVGTDVLSPAFTDYRRRVLYVRYNVSKYLHKGDNIIAVELGNGFYNQTVGSSWGFENASWRDEKRMIFSLSVSGAPICVSDESWRVSSERGTYNTITRVGEYYDARLDGGWRELDFNDDSWACAVELKAPARLVRQTIEPIRECEKLKPVAIYKSPDGWMCDFGKNMAGYVGIKMQGRCGSTVRIRYAELLKDGSPEIDHLNVKWIDENHLGQYVHTDFFSEDRYTFGDGEMKEWKPSFVYHGFRYVELIGLEKKPKKSEITAYFVHTDLKRKGSFTASNELLQWIYDAGVRAFLSNWHGISEDCPHREKNGWTGDAAISCHYAVCLFDMKRAYKKWLTDLSDSQKRSGQLPGITPTCGWGYAWGSGPAWDCALFLIPDALYRETGDTSVIKTVYRTAVRYLKYAEGKKDGDGLVLYGLRDWCPPRELPDLKLADNRFSDSCYYLMMLRIMSRFAGLLNKPEDEKKYAADAEQLLSDIRRVFVSDAGVDNNSQGALAMALYFGIVEGDEGERVAKMLVKRVTEDEYKFKVGILGIKAMLNALSAYGYTDVAYKTVNRYDYPSYGFMKNKGLTTLAEDWECRQSLNHHMYADVVNWQIRNIAGLQNAGVAYDKCLIKPYIYDSECSASAETVTPYGRISVSWRFEGGVFKADIQIPEGVDATLDVLGVKRHIEPGVHTVTV